MDGMGERKMTAEERSFLLRAAKYVGAGSIPDVRGLIALGVVLGAGAGYFRKQHVTPLFIALLVLAGLVFLFAIVLVIAGSKQGSARKKTFRSDVANGIVRETLFEVVDAIAVGFKEDRPEAWCLESGDGRVLYLERVHVGTAADQGEFPSSRIRPAWAPLTDVLVSVACEGSPIRPTATVRESLKAPDGSTPASGSLIKLKFERLKARSE